MLQESRFLRVINLEAAIGELKDLETLDVRGTKVSELPTSFWSIKTLRHVYGSGLILPKQVGNLKYLQTLETIEPDKKYGWDKKTFEGMVFTSPFQMRLRAMALCGELEEPKGKLCVPNLTFLSLKRTKVSQEFIRTVGELPLLENLILEEESYKDGQIVFRYDEFRKLTDLVIMSYNEGIDIEVNKERKFLKQIICEDAKLGASILRNQILKGKVTSFQHQAARSWQSHKRPQAATRARTGLLLDDAFRIHEDLVHRSRCKGTEAEEMKRTSSRIRMRTPACPMSAQGHRMAQGGRI
ncbi:hypothetical protein BAE44_0012919 [Dichanthelium oligosanthes]|uniref:Disease resistance R13L4/SHOC-2-like LRR domain-containing protein n=1 Tax=Dichanthelium oligosanthes TaxID=888268 RepID=A0A1E5VLW6_9POAL|nr:hypothetical protein BAE44_0012919 [Dichanthelium oligosanthes]